ncbi:extensin-like domain-containing protein [Salinarimonas soli]|uniref:Extensin family protein n=1 Tax=Salinarimonas soli TaxID=1638099 RepID=A0A5B2V141_9HYPH|nr:extensin family protein [Salinarimonas soli]KAA2232468.1 extensin family protein [Salinarimonas soli]
MPPSARLLAALAGAVLAATPLAAAPRPVEHPAPPARPADLPGAAGDTPEPRAEAYGPPLPPGFASPAPKAAADPSGPCLDRLKALGVVFETRPAIAAGACGTGEAEPLRVTALSSSLSLSAPSTMVCPMAEALARWAAEAVAPAAREHLDAAPKRLAIGTSYECRGQNRQSGAKLSEHAFANAVDVMAFEFEGKPALTVTFHPDGSPNRRFQDAVRSRACDYFATVLGPGSDASHADHLHLDLRARKRGFKLCQ